MDDIKNKPIREVGESPKGIFRRLPRPAIKSAYTGEDPKRFFRRMAALRRGDANPGPG